MSFICGFTGMTRSNDLIVIVYTQNLWDSCPGGIDRNASEKNLKDMIVNEIEGIEEIDLDIRVLFDDDKPINYEVFYINWQRFDLICRKTCHDILSNADKWIVMQ